MLSQLELPGVCWIQGKTVAKAGLACVSPLTIIGAAAGFKATALTLLGALSSTL